MKIVFVNSKLVLFRLTNQESEDLRLSYGTKRKVLARCLVESVEKTATHGPSDWNTHSELKKRTLLPFTILSHFRRNPQCRVASFHCTPLHRVHIAPLVFIDDLSIG
jgi:hypothetical protein